MPEALHQPSEDPQVPPGGIPPEGIPEPVRESAAQSLSREYSHGEPLAFEEPTWETGASPQELAEPSLEEIGVFPTVEDLRDYRAFQPAVIRMGALYHAGQVSRATWEAWLRDVEQEIYDLGITDEQHVALLEQEHERLMEERIEEIVPTVEGEPVAVEPDVRGLLRRARIERATAPRTAEREEVFRHMAYAETQEVLRDQDIQDFLAEAIPTLTPGDHRRTIDAASLETVAEKLGLGPEEVLGIIRQERRGLEDRARRHVLAEERGTLAGSVGRGLRGAAVSATLRWMGVGLIASIPRVAEVWMRGRAVEQKVAERIAELEHGIAAANHRSPEGPLREILDRISATIAFRKQQQLDALARTSEERARRRGVRGMRDIAVDYQNSVRDYLTHSTDYPPEEIERLANAAARFYIVSEQSAAMESRMAFPEALIGAARKFLPRGETQSKRLMKAGVAAVVGLLAREIPVVGDVLLAYAGAKAGKAAGVLAVERLGKRRYGELTPVTPAEIDVSIGDTKVLNRARLQLLDARFRREHPADFQRLREAVERRTADLLMRASAGEGSVREITAVMVNDLRRLRGKQRERAWITNSAGIAGAAAALVLKYEFFRGGGGGGMMSEERVAASEATAFAAGGTTPDPAAGAMPMATEVTSEPAGAVEVATTPTAEAVAPTPVGVAPSSEAGADKMLDLARIHHGDGATQVFQRQLEANPSAFGYDGDSAGVKSWALAESKRIAIEQGYLGADGRTTTLGLRFKEGAGLLLNRETGTTAVKPIGNIESYIENRALGFGGGGGGNAGGDIPSSEYPDSKVAALEGAEREHVESVATTKGEVTAVESAEKSDDWVQLGEGAASTGAEEVTATSRGVDVAGVHIEFADSVSNADRAHATQFIEFERAKTDEMKKILGQYQGQYGGRPAFKDFANGVKSDIALSDGQVKNVIDAARTGELGDRVKATIEATGNFSPKDAAKMEIDVVAAENNLLSSDERSRDAFADLDAAEKDSNP